MSDFRFSGVWPASDRAGSAPPTGSCSFNADMTHGGGYPKKMFVEYGVNSYRGKGVCAVKFAG
jgi:hypothetical protein